MLRAVINSGTGRGAMLRIPNYGKTGTSQSNRDALFVGYAGDLVVGVWIGNEIDENGSEVTLGQDGVVLTTEIDGNPIEFRLDDDGLAVEAEP